MDEIYETSFISLAFNAGHLGGWIALDNLLIFKGIIRKLISHTGKSYR